MNQTIDLTDTPRQRRHLQVFGIWTGAVIAYAFIMNVQINLPFPYALATSAVYSYSLALLMIPVARWSSGAQGRGVMPHVVVGTAVIVFWLAVNLGYIRLAVGPDFWALTYSQNWLFQLATAVTTYGTALGVTLAFQASDRERDRERRESELLILARDSELAAIKAQMQPHFVLNVLNSVLVLIDKDPALARVMVTRLADLMRAVFEQFEVVQIPLKREMDLTRAYLEIERIRFEPRLSVFIEIDTEAQNTIVPAFLLQPIVENAIKHGIGHRSGPSTLRILGRRRNGRLALSVTNSREPGPLGDLDSASHNGRGLQLTRRRLAATYNLDHVLRFRSDDDTVTVELDLPATEYEHESKPAFAAR
jgi:two-component system LytT family sensor kinase